MRKCIYAFFQPQGREPSYAKQLFQEGNGLLFLAGTLSCRAAGAARRSWSVVFLAG